MASNAFEQAARAKKVARLVAHFDQWITDAGHDPRANAKLVADTLFRMSGEFWTQHAITCGLKPPSDTTREEVIAVYLDRAANPELSGADPFQASAS
jgi:hypothetical protein